MLLLGRPVAPIAREAVVGIVSVSASVRTRIGLLLIVGRPVVHVLLLVGISHGVGIVRVGRAVLALRGRRVAAVAVRTGRGHVPESMTIFAILTVLYERSLC